MAMIANGKCRKISPQAASFSPKGARSECIESPQTFDDGKVDGDQNDRHQRKGRGHRHIADRALLGVHHAADEIARRPHQLRHDKVAQRQREGEDRPGGDARHRQQNDVAEGLRRSRAQIRRGVQQRGGRRSSAAWIGRIMNGSQI